MQGSTLERLAPLSGPLFLVFVAAWAIVLGETPDTDDSTAEVVEFWTDNETEAGVGGILLAFAALSLAWFGGVLRVALRRGEGNPGRLSAVAFGGSLLMALGVALFAGIEFTISDTVKDVPPEVTQTLSVMDSDLFFPMAVGTVLLLGASALVILRTGVLPKWLGWVALVLAIAGVTPAGFFAFLVGIVWIAVVGVMLYLAQGTSPGAAPPPQAPAPPGSA